VEAGEGNFGRNWPNYGGDNRMMDDDDAFVGMEGTYWCWPQIVDDGRQKKATMRNRNGLDGAMAFLGGIGNWGMGRRKNLNFFGGWK
jgi:hypothetical protein